MKIPVFLKRLVPQKKQEEQLTPVSNTGITLPTFNWFKHVLIKNVGYNEWVRMTKEEQENYDKEHPYNAGYPYKVITYPIPAGKDIILKDSNTYTIKCDSA